MAGRNNTPASRKRPREPSCTPPASPNQSLQSQPSSPRQARPSPPDLVHQPSAGTSNTWAPYQSAGSQTNRGAKTRAAAAAAAALAAAASANSAGHPFNWAQPTSEVHKSKTKERAPSPGRSTSSLVSSSSPDPQPLALVHHTRPAVGASSESQASSTSSGAAGASSPVPGSSNSSRRSAVVLPASSPPSSSPASSTGTGARGTAKATKRDREREPKPTTTTTTNNTFSSKESPASGPPSAHNGLVVVSALCRQQMKEAFQPWVLQTYGDAAKTKTISRRKFERICKILKGEDRSNGADSSKFRFWVRAKGFRLGPPPHMAAEQTDAERNNDDQEALYVVTGSYKDSSGVEQAQYKKVAVVENFFDIIYHEHVENGGRLTGKHAGQKRTYKAITEIHAFLPREAVTRFLLQCAECQRRGTYTETGANGSPSRVETPSGSPPSTPVPPDHQQQQPASRQASSGKNTHSTKSPPPSLHPPQPTPHRRGGGPRGSGGVGPVAWPAFPGTLPPLAWGPNWTPVAGGSSNGNSNGDGDPQRSPSFYTLKASDIDLSLPLTTTLLKHARRVGLPEERLLGCDRVEASFANNDNAPLGESRQGMTSAVLGKVEESDEWVGYRALGLKKAIPASQASLSSPFGTSGSSSMATNTGSSTPLAQGLSPPLSLAASLPGPGAASRDTGSPTMEVTVKNETVDETSSIGNKDDDDDEEDDADDKMDTLVHDPERLKAFNMFVRLFVDENLDRMVPISRQPREKVQAIIDSCTRQFPEFGERARKRIRTYLKSCRRNKRSRDSNGWDTTRPTPPHLTSAAAEQILAQACENENQNAKRLRLGLEPISQPLPTPSTADRVLDTISSATGTTTSSATTGLDSNGAFRTAFGSPYNRTGGTLAITSSSSTSTSSNPPPANPYSSLPTDLSVKKAPTNHSSSTSTMTISSQTPSPCRTSPLPHKLNAAEMLAVRQLVTGYRESAAFLLRSADELEQLLLQQH